MPKQSLTVIKIGTQVITDSYGKTDIVVLHHLANQIKKYSKKGHRFCLVCSGAIGMGMSELNVKTRPSAIVDRQACASIGQGLLMNQIHDVFAHYDLKIGQVLLSKEDCSRQPHKKNLMACLKRLFSMKVVPIINENDVISTYEIERAFGDNDQLAATLAVAIKANQIAFLTSVDGVMDPQGFVFSTLDKKEAKNVKISSKTHKGSGGMKSKIEAGLQCAKAGVKATIGNGKDPNFLTSLMYGQEPGTQIL